MQSIKIEIIYTIKTRFQLYKKLEKVFEMIARTVANARFKIFSK